jgi:hypothetical protein
LIHLPWSCLYDTWSLDIEQSSFNSGLCNMVAEWTEIAFVLLPVFLDMTFSPLPHSRVGGPSTFAPEWPLVPSDSILADPAWPNHGSLEPRLLNLSAFLPQKWRCTGAN